MLEIGQRVKHQGKYCNVLDSWDSGQGYRYYVSHSGFTWSVTEKEVTPVIPRKRKQGPRKYKNKVKDN